jgi:hypothetical protein
MSILKNSWMIYAHMPFDTNWSLDSYKKIYKMKTAEDVKTLMCEINHNILVNCMIFMMRDNIDPVWEHPENKNGGAFSFKVFNEDVPTMFIELVYNTVNGIYGENVTGISISPKRNFCIVKLWLSKKTHIPFDFKQRPIFKLFKPTY